MKIYTSYFAKLKDIEKMGITPIAICCMPPKFFTGVNMDSLAPSKDILLNCKTDHKLYEKRFRNEILSIHKNPQILIDRLNYISDGKDVALLCYEKSGEFCHRHIVAAWLKETMGIEVDELSFKNEMKSEPLF